MTNGEAVNWIINISADIGKAKHSDLWHYEQALSEIREMLESVQPEIIRCKDCKSWGRLVTYKDGSTMIDCKRGRSMGPEGYCHLAELRGDTNVNH